MQPSPPAHPQSPRDLFVSFTLLALQGFGGVLAIVQREMVEKKKWLTPEQFLEDWAVAQVMPGPNVINLALMIGDRYFGLRGAVAAVAGMLTVPLFRDPRARGALRALRGQPAGRGARCAAWARCRAG
jgi:chromate transporter